MEANSYMKAIQLRKQLNEIAKETKKLRLSAIQRIKDAECRYNSYDSNDKDSQFNVNGMFHSYMDHAREAMGEKRYEKAHILSSIAIIALKNPKKAIGIYQILETVSSLEERNFEIEAEALEKGLMTSIEEYYAEGVLRLSGNSSFQEMLKKKTANQS